MCLSLYIVSDRALRTLPWDESRMGFHVINETDPRHHLTWAFGKKYFCRAVCHMGCGCGFERGRMPEWDDERGEIEVDDYSENQASRRGLADFLAAALRHQTAVEADFWSGEIPPVLKPRRRARPADFTSDYTLFGVAGQVVVVSEHEVEPAIAPVSAGSDTTQAEQVTAADRPRNEGLSSFTPPPA